MAGAFQSSTAHSNRPQPRSTGDRRDQPAQQRLRAAAAAERRPHVKVLEPQPAAGRGRSRSCGRTARNRRLRRRRSAISTSAAGGAPNSATRRSASVARHRCASRSNSASVPDQRVDRGDVRLGGGPDDRSPAPSSPTPRPEHREVALDAVELGHAGQLAPVGEAGPVEQRQRRVRCGRTRRRATSAPPAPARRRARGRAAPARFPAAAAAGRRRRPPRRSRGRPAGRRTSAATATRRSLRRRRAPTAAAARARSPGTSPRARTPSPARCRRSPSGPGSTRCRCRQSLANQRVGRGVSACCAKLQQNWPGHCNNRNVSLPGLRAGR